MLESYIRTPDGKDYVDVDCVMEALGIVDEDVNIFSVIEKLREDKDLLEELHANHISQLNDYAELAFELGIESGDAESLKDYIVSLKRERDELKEKCDKLKRRANAMYGASCGYSASKQPALHCNVTRLETLLAIDAVIDELCDKFNVVQPDRKSTTKERLDYIFGVLAENRERYNSEWKRVEELKKEKRTVVDSLAELRAKIREIYRSVVDDEWDEYRGYSSISALNDINEEYKRVVHNFEERTADWSKAQQELDRYRLAVGSLLGIPKETRDDINAIERAFTFSKKKYESLQEFRNDVCEIFDIPSSMTYNYILKEIRDVADRYDELEDFRADICGALDIEGMMGTPQQNDKYILEQVEKMRDDSTRLDRYARLRSDICTALCLGGETSDEDILKTVRRTKDCHDALCDDCADLAKDHTELRKAIWEAMDRKPETLPEEDARLVGEVAELARGEKLLIEFRDDVAKAIGMDYPTTNQVILNNVQYIYKDRKDAYEIVSKLNDQVTELSKDKEELGRDLCELRKNAIEDLKSRGFCFRPEENETLPEIYDKLLKGYDWAYGSYKDQYRLRQCWHVRYESENERANGEHKRAEKLNNEVKGWTKRCDSLQTALNNSQNDGVALQTFRNECRKLKDEKAKVISALGQDIWDDCVK